MSSARPRNTSDANSPMVSTLTLDIDGNIVEIPTHEYLQEITTEVNEAAGGKMTVRLFDSDQDALEDILLGLSGQQADIDVRTAAVQQLSGKRIILRFGWDRGDLASLPIYKGIITGYEPDFAPEGTTITLNVVADAVVLAALNKKPRGFAAGLTASAIFTQIATDNGWPMIVEPSFGPMEELTSNTESDVKFLRDKVLPRAINTAKQGFVMYFDLDGTAHFHSPGFNGTQKQGTESPLDAEYTFAADAFGDVISFTPSDNALAAAVYGAGSSVYTGSDGAGGKQVIAAATPASGPGGASVPSVGGGVFRPAASGLTSRIHVPTRSMIEFEQRTAARWSQIARYTYTAALQVRGTHALRTGGYIRVRRLRRDGREHHLSGVFLVTGVKHTFGSGGWLTDASLVRPGMQYTPGANPANAVPTKSSVTDSNTQRADGNGETGPQESFGETVVQ